MIHLFQNQFQLTILLKKRKHKYVSYLEMLYNLSGYAWKLVDIVIIWLTEVSLKKAISMFKKWNGLDLHFRALTTFTARPEKIFGEVFTTQI